MNRQTPWRCCPRIQNRSLAGLRLLALCQNAPFRATLATSRPPYRPSKAARDDDRKPKSPLLNPPATTRPPPLTLPQRSDYDSTPQYLLQLGKGYLTFFKDGLKSVWANHKLLRDKIQRTPRDDRPSIFRPRYVPQTFSRADWVLLWRVRHDLLRLPLFGLMLIVIGEFTVLVVAYVDGAVPYPCRLPKQVISSLETAEHRRALCFNELESRYPGGALNTGLPRGAARSHVLRSLHIAGTMWDRLGFIPPGMWHTKGMLRMAFLEGDDRNLIEDGGPMGLESEELRVACVERGIGVLGKKESELTRVLGDWLRLTAAEDPGERRRRMAVLLLSRPENWPSHRGFDVPKWEL